MSTLLIQVGDTHINSMVALCPPVVNLDGGGSYRSSRGQRWLWECWLDMWSSIKANYPEHKKVLVLTGDLGELDTKRRSYQLISPNKATIQAIVLDTLEPPLDCVDSVYVIRGTQAHTGKSAWLEEAIANDLDITVANPEDGASWYWLRLDVDGVRFDIAHHATMGGLPWTGPNAANKVAFLAETYYHRLRQPLPHVVMRSHNHTYADSGGNFETFAMFTRCWSLMTEYGYRTNKELSLAHIGSTVFDCKEGDYEKVDYKYEPRHERGRVWALKA